MGKQSNWLTVIRNATIGMGICTLATILLCGILALISTKVAMSNTACFLFAVMAISISWFFGAFTSGYMNKKSGLVIGLVFSGGMLMLLILISLITKSGGVQFFNLKSILYFVVGPIIGALGGIVGVHRALKRRFKN